MTKVVYTAGTWDLFHKGHLNIIKRSRKLGDYLIVAVSTDELVLSYKKVKPFFPFEERLEIIEALKYPDKVVVQTELIKTADLINYEVNLVTIGDSWKGKYLPGLEWMKEHGEVVYLPYTKGISSNILRKRICKDFIENYNGKRSDRFG